MPTLPPIMKARTTKAIQPRMAVLRCLALQRPARAAMLRDWSACGSPGRCGGMRADCLDRAPRTSGRTLNRIPETLRVARAVGSDRLQRPDRPSGASAELAQLEAALDALDDGRVGVRGRRGRARGSARRACSRELRERAEERGYLVLAGAAAEFERDLPFSVWVDALDAYVAAQHELDGWTATLVAELAASCRRCGAAGGAGAAGRRRALPRAPRRARRCWRRSPTSSRSCSCSTTCTGATRRRSS